MRLVSRLVLGPVLGTVPSVPPRLLVAGVLKEGKVNDGTKVTSLLGEG